MIVWNDFDPDKSDTHPDCANELCLAWVSRANFEGGYAENFPTVGCFWNGQWHIEARDGMGRKFENFVVTRWSYINRPV